MINEIKLLKNNDNRTDSDLEWIEEFYNFLQGNMPKNVFMKNGHKPKMTEKKAFAIIWYLQEHFSILPDSIERCDSCGNLFDMNCGGEYSESKGTFCSDCEYLILNEKQSSLSI